MTQPTDIAELKGHVRYPLPPTAFSRYADDLDLYVRFMRHLRATHYTNAGMKILSAIQFTADMTGRDDADVALSLICLGLRAPREAFPAIFLNMIDQAVCRQALGQQEMAPALVDLLLHWRGIGAGGVLASESMPAGAECCDATFVHA